MIREPVNIDFVVNMYINLEVQNCEFVMHITS